MASSRIETCHFFTVLYVLSLDNILPLGAAKSLLWSLAGRSYVGLVSLHISFQKHNLRLLLKVLAVLPFFKYSLNIVGVVVVIILSHCITYRLFKTRGIEQTLGQFRNLGGTERITLTHSFQ